VQPCILGLYRRYRNAVLLLLLVLADSFSFSPLTSSGLWDECKCMYKGDVEYRRCTVLSSHTVLVFIRIHCDTIVYSQSQIGSLAYALIASHWALYSLSSSAVQLEMYFAAAVKMLLLDMLIHMLTTLYRRNVNTVRGWTSSSWLKAQWTWMAISLLQNLLKR